MAITKFNGVISWDRSDFVEYNVTGVTTVGERFKIVTRSWPHAAGINLYRGTRWGIKPDGKRVRLESVYN